LFDTFPTQNNKKEGDALMPLLSNFFRYVFTTRGPPVCILPPVVIFINGVNVTKILQ
jgi:hypothetical protein